MSGEGYERISKRTTPFLTLRPMRVKNSLHAHLLIASVHVPVPRGAVMIESTKPVTASDDEPEILARYTKYYPRADAARVMS